MHHENHLLKIIIGHTWDLLRLYLIQILFISFRVLYLEVVQGYYFYAETLYFVITIVSVMYLGIISICKIYVINLRTL
jgi:hypothetical protein